jgi:hypothetical protein
VTLLSSSGELHSADWTGRGLLGVIEAKGQRSQEVVICWGYIAGLAGLPFSALGRDSNWNPPLTLVYKKPTILGCDRGSRHRIKCQTIWVRRWLLVGRLITTHSEVKTNTEWKEDWLQRPISTARSDKLKPTSQRAPQPYCTPGILLCYEQHVSAT